MNSPSFYPVYWIMIACLSAVVFVLVRRLQVLQHVSETSEEQYRVIFETVTDGLLINSLDGTVVEANPAAYQMHGYTREEFIGQSAAEFVHPDSLHLFREYVEALNSGRTFHTFAKDLRKDGSEFDVEVDGVPFQFRGRPHLLGIVRDVTDRMKTHEALKYSEELNRRIVESVPGGIVNVAMNGAILNANEEAQKFLGLSRDELTNLFVNDYQSTSIFENGKICEPKDFPVSRCLQSGEAHGPLTLGVRRPDGEIKWAIFSAVPLFDERSGTQKGAIVIFLDITQRKQVEQELQESEERFRLLAESAPGVIYLCQNDERYTMNYLSESVFELTGYTADEFKRDEISFVELYHPDDESEISREVEAALKEDRAFRLRYRIWHRNGGFRWIEEVGVGVYRDGELVYLEGFLNDVTEHVHAEEALKASQKALFIQQQLETDRVAAELEKVRNRLVQSTRLATIGKMAAQIAHEIRNPLAIIKNAAYFVGRKLPEAETKAKINLDRIQTEIRTCDNIIENILSSTKIQPPKKTTLELEPIINTAAARLQELEQFQNRPFEVGCEYRGTPEKLCVLVDQGQFRQVLDNLLKNAAEAMEGNGTISVKATETVSQSTIEISDTGPGVPAEQAESVFEVFQTTKAKGTGLGLGICRQIIEGHGGTLRLVVPKRTDLNSPPKGATFEITLPKPETPPT